MKHSVFAYGLLKYPKLVAALIGREPDTAPATLANYQRMQLGVSLDDGCAMIVEAPNMQVVGLLVKGLTDKELEIFDLFEYLPQGIYARSEVQVLSENASLPCYAYTLGKNADTSLLNGEWNEQAYVEAFYDDFLNATIPQFLEEVNNGSGHAPWNDWAAGLTGTTQ